MAGPRSILVAFIVFTAVSFMALGGGGPQNVLVVVNDESLDSLAIGRYYATQRGIPDRNICHLSVPPDAVNLATNQFQTSVVARIHSHIAEFGLTNQIDYIVLVQDLPSRVNDSEGATAVLFYGFKNAPTYWMAGCNLPTNTKSFYYQAERAFHRQDSYGGTNYYLGTLLLADRIPRAISNVDRSVFADGTSPTGTMYLNKSADVYRNIRYLRYDDFDFTARFFSNFPGYVFGSAYPHSNIIALCDGVPNYSSNFWNNTTFSAGAIADHLTSYGGRLKDPSTGQSTVMDWMKAGVAGSYGTVTEPCAYLEKFPSPLALFWYARGFNLAESYWMSVANPHMGLFVGDPLTAPYAKSPSVQIISPADGSTVSGIVTVEVAATVSSGFIRSIELFLDDLWFQTLTNIQPRSGNIATIRVDTVTYTYVVGPTDTLYSTVARLADSVNASQQWVRAQAYGDRLVLVWTNYGVLAGALSCSASTAVGSADELTLYARVLQTNFLESQYFAREGIQISSYTSAGANSGDTVSCVITLTNGLVITNRIVASQGQSVSSIMTALMNSINTHPDLMSTDGIAAVDYVPYSTLANAYLQARKPGPEGWNLYVDFVITQAIFGSGLRTNDTFHDHFNDNDDVLTARATILFASGRESVTAHAVWNTSLWPDGRQQIWAVAKEGSAIEAQGHAWVTVVVSNSPFQTWLIAPTNGTSTTVGSNITVELAVTNAAGAVVEAILYAEGKPAVVWTNPPFVTNLSTRFYGVGTLTLYGEARDSAGRRSRSPPVTVTITMSSTIDTDADGLPDAWEQLYFPTYWYGATNNLDSDELSNYGEYIADTDPWDAGSVFRILNLSRETNNDVRISFLASTQRLYTIQFNEEFIHGAFNAWQSTTSSPFWGSGGTMAWIDDGSETPAHPSLATGRVYRVRVELP